MPRIVLRVVLAVGAVAAVLFGSPWALRPFLNPPQGLHPTGWSYAQLIRERYPIHLIDPAWLSNDIWWSLAETIARILVVALAVIFILTLVRRTRHENPAA
jgi:hypothetical protein